MINIGYLPSSNSGNQAELSRIFDGNGRFCLQTLSALPDNRETLALLSEGLQAGQPALLIFDDFNNAISQTLAHDFPGRMLTVMRRTGADGDYEAYTLSSDGTRELVCSAENTTAGEFWPLAVDAALRRLGYEFPPAIPVNVDQAWAECLKVPYDPARFTPPPVPASASATRQTRPTTQAAQLAEPMPPSYMIWSVLALVFCCLVPGIVAVIYSSQVTTRYTQGDLEGSRRASRMAQIWIIISFITGILWSTLYLPFLLVS